MTRGSWQWLAALLTVVAAGCVVDPNGPEDTGAEPSDDSMVPLDVRDGVIDSSTGEPLDVRVGPPPEAGVPADAGIDARIDASTDARDASTPDAGPPTDRFFTSLEPRDVQPTWNNSSVSSIFVTAAPGASLPRCSARQEAPRIAHSGLYTLRVDGTDTTSGGASRIRWRAFQTNLRIATNTILRYYVRTKSVVGANVSIDLEFDDGTYLSALPSPVDHRNCSLRASNGHCGAIAPNAWVPVESAIGQWAAGRIVREIHVVYERPAGTGVFETMLDDIRIEPRIAGCPITASPLAISTTSRVIPLYLSASDEPAEDRTRRLAAYRRALIGIQRFYGEAMGSAFGNQTFKFEPIRTITSRYTRAQWDDFGTNGFLGTDGRRHDPDGVCGMYHAANHELQNGGLTNAGLPALFTRGTIYYAIGGGGVNGSCGAAADGSGFAASEAKLLDEMQELCPSGRHDRCATECAAVGAIAHELGHGFGLPHASDRSTPCSGRSLMDEWWDYDEGASLCSLDRRDLNASPFFATP